MASESNTFATNYDIIDFVDSFGEVPAYQPAPEGPQNNYILLSDEEFGENLYTPVTEKKEEEEEVIEETPKSTEKPEKTKKKEKKTETRTEANTIRDWNEEFQNLIESETTFETLEKLTNLSHDFVETAEQYGKVIISERWMPENLKTIPSASVGGVAGGEKYIAQGILFKFSMDAELNPGVWLYGGNKSSEQDASKAADHELKGLINVAATIKKLGLSKQLHFPLVAIINYRGCRLIAVSFLPLGKKSLVYGSNDGTNVVKKDKEAAKLMKKICLSLNLGAHIAGKNERLIYGPGDIEVHLGTDGRYYILDFARLMPPQAPCPGNGRKIFFELLRPAFVSRYAEPLSSDAFSGWSYFQIDKFHEENKKVSMASRMLMDKIIPAFGDQLMIQSKVYEKSEDFSLVNEIHSAGINLRHIGQIRKHIAQSDFSKTKEGIKQYNIEWLNQILLEEMVLRVISQLMQSQLRKKVEQNANVTYIKNVVQFLNLLLDYADESDIFWNQKIKALLLDKYGYALNEDESTPFSDLRQFVSLKTVIKKFTEHSGISVHERVLSTLEDKPNKYRHKREHALVVDTDISFFSKTKSMNISDTSQSIFLRKTGMEIANISVESATSLFNLSIEKASKALAKNPTDAGLLYKRGKSYMQKMKLNTKGFQNQVQNTIQDFHGAITLGKDGPFLHLYHGICLAWDDQFSQGKQEIEIAFQQFSKSEPKTIQKMDNLLSDIDDHFRNGAWNLRGLIDPYYTLFYATSYFPENGKYLLALCLVIIKSLMNEQHPIWEAMKSGSPKHGQDIFVLELSVCLVKAYKLNPTLVENFYEVSKNKFSLPFILQAVYLILDDYEFAASQFVSEPSYQFESYQSFENSEMRQNLVKFTDEFLFNFTEVDSEQISCAPVINHPVKYIAVVKIIAQKVTKNCENFRIHRLFNSSLLDACLEVFTDIAKLQNLKKLTLENTFLAHSQQIWKNIPNLQELHLKSIKGIPTKLEFDLLPVFEEISRLKLKSFSFEPDSGKATDDDDVVFQILFKKGSNLSENVINLKLGGWHSRLKEESVKLLIHCENLENLQLTNFKLNSQQCALMLNSLKKLTYFAGSFAKDCLPLKDFTSNLKQINLHGSDSTDDELAQFFQGFPKLEEIALSSVYRSGQKTIDSIYENCENIKTIHFPQHWNKALTLEHCNKRNVEKALFNSGRAEFGNLFGDWLSNITVFNMHNLSKPEEIILLPKHLPNVRVFSLVRCSARDDVCQELQENCPNVEKVCFNACWITHVGCYYLSKINKLKAVDISECDHTNDYCIDYLIQNQALETLLTFRSNLTRAAIIRIIDADAPKLTIWGLERLENFVTSFGVLRKKKPNLELIGDNGGKLNKIFEIPSYDVPFNFNN